MTKEEQTSFSSSGEAPFGFVTWIYHTKIISHRRTTVGCNSLGDCVQSSQNSGVPFKEA